MGAPTRVGGVLGMSSRAGQMSAVGSDLRDMAQVAPDVARTRGARQNVAKSDAPGSEARGAAKPAKTRDQRVMTNLSPLPGTLRRSPASGSPTLRAGDAPPRLRLRARAAGLTGCLRAAAASTARRLRHREAGVDGTPFHPVPLRPRCPPGGGSGLGWRGRGLP